MNLNELNELKKRIFHLGFHKIEEEAIVEHIRQVFSGSSTPELVPVRQRVINHPFPRRNR